MRKKPNTAVKQEETDDQVKLKPLMGIRPGVYLTVLYSGILLVILFFLLIFPGLSSPGALLLVKTEPEMSAIRVNDTYMGVSGSFFHIPKGTQTIEAVLPGFETERTILEIPGRIFGSLFFPIRKKIELTLKTNNPTGALAKAASEFAAWSFAGEPTSSWQVPLVLSENAYRAGPYAPPETNEILKAASRFAATRFAVRDLVRAKILLDNAGSSPSPAGLLGSISDILVFLSENPGSAAWLAGLLPPEPASLIESSNWRQNEYASEKTSIPNQDAGGQNRLALNGITFINIPPAGITGGIANESKPPRGVSLNAFMISENPVSRTLFETFLNENPQWEDCYTDYFEEEISVFPSEAYERDTVTGISWFGAEAFCQWLNKRLPSSMAEMEVRLPTELEWEYAAKSGVESMKRTGWEWCADPFAPLQFIAASADAIEAVGSPERVLRGKPSSSAEQTRASLPPDLSSPFVTFRLVIAQRAVN